MVANQYLRIFSRYWRSGLVGCPSTLTTHPPVGLNHSPNEQKVFWQPYAKDFFGHTTIHSATKRIFSSGANFLDLSRKVHSPSTNRLEKGLLGSVPGERAPLITRLPITYSICSTQHTYWGGTPKTTRQEASSQLPTELTRTPTHRKLGGLRSHSTQPSTNSLRSRKTWHQK